MEKRKELIAVSIITVVTLSLVVYQKVAAADVPTLKEGTYLSGQTLSVWPSWSLLGNALGQALPTDPINQLAAAGTCATTTNRFCLSDGQCPNNEACILHDPNTGWSTTDRRFSFACNRDSYAYRYITSSSTAGYTVRTRFEDPGFTPANFNNFVAGFISTSIFKINEDAGVCNFDQEISTFQSGTCGDGRLNLNRGEQCDPPGRIQYQAGCVGSTKNLTVCNNTCQWVASTTLCSSLSKCGNGVKEAGEICDDGQLNGKYNHCNSTCNGISPLGRCGNGQVEAAYEVCDPGTPGVERYSLTSKEDSCSWDCQNFGPYCGNTITETQHREECDGSRSCSIGSVAGTRACASSCKQVATDEAVWLRFEELTTNAGGGVTQDRTANNNDASCATARCPVRVQGKYGNALSFNGNSNVTFLTVNHGSSVDANQALTVEAWVNLSSYNSNYQRIAEKKSGSSGYDLEVNISSDVHTARFNLWNGTQTSVDSNVSIPTGTWTHIVGTFERNGQNNTAKIYVNGNLESTHTSVTPDSIMGASTANLFIGAASGGSGNYLLGFIDEVKIYNRALSADAVRDNYQNNWSCNVTAPIVVNTPGACGNNVVDANEACDRGTANNGRACTPTYNQSCSYCAADCQNTIDVQPTQYCGNGIIEAVEKCDMASDGIIYAAATSSDNTTVTSRDAAHNGFQELTCSAEANTVPHTLKKGTKTCGNCTAGVVRNCVSCGVDPNGVTVGGGLINVLQARTNPDPLFVREFTTSSAVLSIGPCYTYDLAGLRNICGTTLAGSPAVGKAQKVRYVTTDLVNYTLQNPYAMGSTALINSDPSCSTDDANNRRYKMYLNSDWGHVFNFNVIAAPQSWQYDMVLSPVVLNSQRNKDLRIVVSWVGPEDFYSGILNPFISNPEITGASYCNGSSCGSTQRNVSTGVDYFNTANSTWYGVWYHAFNATAGQTNAESFTINTAAMSGNTYSVFVKSPSSPIRQFRNTAKLKVEVYLPESDSAVYQSQTLAGGTDYNRYRFGTPVKTYYLQAASPSENQNAKYWQVFNINKPADANAISANDIIDVNAIITNAANFRYSAPLVIDPNAQTESANSGSSGSTLPPPESGGGGTVTQNPVTAPPPPSVFTSVFQPIINFFSP